MIAPRLLIALLLFGVSCQTKPKQESAAKSTTAATTEDSAASLAKRPAEGAPRSAADRLVRALYFEHNKKENPLRETKDRGLIEQFFTKTTTDIIWADAQKKPGKINRATVNLLYNAPDASIKKMWVEPAAIGGTKAIVYVTFEKNSKPEEVKVDMQQIAGRWRIAEMHYPDGKRLTELLK
ncbi:hypothetical protein IC229_10000 [Spirosoma sp. BT702]|uniref:DUF3828 domain-containing protein n=1 Tax=Spirosoma profusum TaxID=2771354 RepID=A0A926Y2N1_9BACT|nr:hypothetical protein [Spirosoma profusum]MBD2700971.1 hypothetical protein [Spirosoma profusum]